MMNSSVMDFLIGTAGFKGSAAGSAAGADPRPARDWWTERISCGSSAMGTEFRLT